MMYVYMSEDHYLSPSVAFVAISLLDKLKHNLGMVPHIISHMIKVTVSVKRLNEFLGRNELEDSVTCDEEDAISIKNGFFSWSSGTPPTLKNINMSVKKGSLVAVVGSVGCGKSSLLSACLGEMRKLKGNVSMRGSVAYVPQQAWIQHATLKDNVLFGQDLDEGLYQRCLDDCALRDDLDILPAGDRTEIGEKGINLSGGQKQRVSLARAAYNKADVYLFDDPLSAVDCHVGSHIFDRVIGHQGMLAGKTRVLVTHGVQWLPKVDQILVVRHGRVTETGSYDQLLTHNGPFAKFLKSYLEDSEGNASSSSSDNEALIQEMLRSVSQEEQQDNEKENTSDEDCDKKEKRKEESDEVEKTPQKQSDGKLMEDEDDKLQQAKWSSLVDFGRMTGLRWAALLLALFLASEMSERAGELALSQWTDDRQLANLTALSRDSEERVDLNNHYLMVYVAFGVIQSVATMSFKTVMLLRKVVVARILHNRMLSRVLHAPMTFFDTTPVGRIVTRFSSDLHAVDNDFVNIMEWAGYILFNIVSKFFIVCYVTPPFLFNIVIIALVFQYVQTFCTPTFREMQRLESRAKGPIYSYFSESLGGTAVIRAFGAQDRFQREFQRRYDLRNAVEFCWGSAHKWLTVRMGLLSCFVTMTVVLTAVASRDVLSAAMVGLALTQALDITGSVHGLVHMLSEVQTKLVSVDRINEYSTMKQEAEWRKEENQPAASWPEQGEVVARDLALRYREGLDLVLKGISVKIGAGEKVGIVGRTGAGKSSLTLALFRLIEPARGEVRIDDVSTSSLGLHDLRSRLTILPQDPVIFAGSLRMNLDPFARFADKEVWESLRHAHLIDFVEGLKDGLDHECGEGGENLSVGQRQLLCLARTLLHRSRVLVLDEATAAVDVQTDDLIQNTIRCQFRDCTVLTIAHRLNTVIDYDKILVLDKGQVVEFDSPSTLMSDPSSLFHHMCRKAGLLHKQPA
ncbi:multidrug resistance-associated protein 1-like [Babylonia areolata]|uniref:multidrug resistance-associated protein 1-like n=1 Tax=Babylonia areolata TaxID=304850 RepID=UPI003FD5E68A